MKKKWGSKKSDWIRENLENDISVSLALRGLGTQIGKASGGLWFFKIYFVKPWGLSLSRKLKAPEGLLLTTPCMIIFLSASKEILNPCSS